MSTKNKVLTQLMQQAPQYISGEEIAKQLNISRTAIWKAMNELKKEGHHIESSTKKGYRYLPSDVLSAEGIRLYIEDILPSDFQIDVVKETASTNKDLKMAAIQGTTAPRLLIAESQTATVGRFGRQYFAKNGDGLYFSYLLTPNLKIPIITQYTLMAAVAVCQAVEKETGIYLDIKWVNDLYLHGKKVCGILSEALTDIESGTFSNIIVGIGLNFSIKAEDFPEELQEKATSLFQKISPTVTRNQLLASITKHFLQLIQAAPNEDFLDEYRRRSFILGKEVSFIKNQQSITGIAKEINIDGALVVTLPDGREITLNSGEISLTKYGN